MQTALKQRLQGHAFARSLRSCRPAALARPSSLQARAAAVTPAEVTTSQYEKELKDAKEAVRLAARLCQASRGGLKGYQCQAREAASAVNRSKTPR